MQIKYKIGGHEVSPDHLNQAIEAEAFNNVRQQLNAKVSGLRCPEHGGPPELQIEGDSLKNLKIQVRACCEAQRQQALTALSTKK